MLDFYHRHWNEVALVQRDDDLNWYLNFQHYGWMGYLYNLFEDYTVVTVVVDS